MNFAVEVEQNRKNVKNVKNDGVNNTRLTISIHPWIHCEDNVMTTTYRNYLFLFDDVKEEEKEIVNSVFK